MTGATAYPRIIDPRPFRQIADEVGTLFMFDAAHVAGLIAGGMHPNPMEHGADIMTFTTHKTLRGPRGGAFNALDELTGNSAGTTYTYDGDGRLATEKGEAGATSYSWAPLDELTGVEGPTATSALTYDSLGRLATRTSGGATRSLHYGDLGDDPVLGTTGKSTEGLIQGPGGLLTETTESEGTSWPLLDGHGSVVGTVGGSGEVESRSSYGPWGESVEGEVPELGYLGGYGRLTDPSTGNLTMGARAYDPALGAFLSQDPLLGHALNPITLDPYPYVGNEPLGRYDLRGREFDPLRPAENFAEGVAGTAAEFGESTAGSAAEFGQSVAGTAAEGGEFVAGKASQWTAPVRHAVAAGAQDFVKAASNHTLGICLGVSAGAVFGINGQTCVVGNLHGVGVTGSVGAGLSAGVGAEASVGPQFSNAHSVSELSGPFASGGVSAGEGVVAGAEGATGTTAGNREVNVVEPHAGLGVGSFVTGNAGVSKTWTAGIGW